MVEAPEPRVMDEPGESVWLDMMYWDCAFGVMVLPSTIIGARALAAGVNALRAEVVRILDPAALVVVRIMAGRWVAEERTLPSAFVKVMMVGRDAETEAVERLVEETMLP